MKKRGTLTCLSLTGVAPFVEAFAPLSAEAGFEVWVEVLKGVLLVTGQRVDVLLQKRLESREIRQAERLVDFADFANGIAFEFFECNFGVIPAGNQGAVFEEGVIHQAVQADEPVVEVGNIRLLQVVPRGHDLKGSAGGLETGDGVAM